MTLTTRFAIEGGMEQETAYNTSDLYIQTVDNCTSIDQVRTLHEETCVHFVEQMRKLKKQDIYSKQVIHCIDYIYEHLHESIKINDLANAVNLNPNYLSVLFKKEMGIPVSEYIRRKKVEAAENMLKYSTYSLTEISEYLAFSSYSHFASIFRKYTNYTPKKYSKEFFRISSLGSTTCEE